MSKIRELIDQEELYRTEGSRGFSNLCKIVRMIGYKDPLNQGQLSQGGSTGDLMCFFEDNSGAIDAVIDWIAKQRSTEWDEEIESQLQSDEDDEENDDEE